jgi:hypothetical protein
MIVLVVGRKWATVMERLCGRQMRTQRRQPTLPALLGRLGNLGHDTQSHFSGFALTL